jgi:hypothetical protein
MRAYTVKLAKGVELPEGKTQKTVYAGSQSEAAEAKKAVQEEHDLKRTQVIVDQVDIPTSKGDLIPWLNKL